MKCIMNQALRKLNVLDRFNQYNTTVLNYKLTPILTLLHVHFGSGKLSR